MVQGKEALWGVRVCGNDLTTDGSVCILVFRV